jgi:membrane protease YdiL (CAAX protease family)
MEQKSELTIGKTILFLIALIIIQSILISILMFICGIVYTILNPGVNPAELTSILNASAILNAINLLFVEITFFALALILGHKFGTPVVSLFQNKRINTMLVAFIVFFSMSYMIVASELENIFASIFGRMRFVGEFMTNISKGPGIGGLIASIFVIGVVPSIAEETLFRGVIQKNLSLRYGILKALIVTSLLFALVHINLSSIVSIFLLGLMLGYLYLKTQNLMYPIILHFFYNLSADLLTRSNVIEIKGLTTGHTTIEHTPVIILVPAILISVLFALIIHKTIESKSEYS